MKYVNAKAVLPHHLVEELQEYIQADMATRQYMP